MKTFTIIFCLLLTVASSLGGTYSFGGDELHEAPYHFEYGVHDPHTGDIKTQFEKSDGKNVVGGYTMKEADGTTRIVKYHADPHGGFNAVVERIGHAQHPAHYGHHGKGGHGGSSYVGTTHFGYGEY